MSHGHERFTRGGAMLGWLTGLLLLGIALDFVSFFSTQSQLELLRNMQAADREFGDLDGCQVHEDNDAPIAERLRKREKVFDDLNREAAENDRRQQTIAFSQIGLYVVTAFFFLGLLNRANRNARALGALNMEFTPGWCIGWFFVPVANLFKPFQAVKETWKASIVSDRFWQDNPASPLLGLLWALWLLGNLLGQILFRMPDKTIDELISVSQFSMFNNALDVPLALVALIVVRKMYSLQDEKHALVGDLATDAVSESMSCRHCGEPVTSMIGDCPMCGEPLRASIADPARDDIRRL